MRIIITYFCHYQFWSVGMDTMKLVFSLWIFLLILAFGYSIKINTLIILFCSNRSFMFDQDTMLSNIFTDAVCLIVNAVVDADINLQLISNPVWIYFHRHVTGIFMLQLSITKSNPPYTRILTFIFNYWKLILIITYYTSI